MHQHTYTALYAHIVFATHSRRASILTSFRTFLHQYIDGIAANAGARPIQTGGVADHVHVLVEMPAEISVAELVRLIKCNSSKWVRQSFSRHFRWQRGYSAFSVSRSNVDIVARYIANQEQHHRRMTVTEEVTRLVERHCVSPAA